jgi:hypothetical protein
VLAALADGRPGALELFAAIVAALAPGAEVLGEKTPNHLQWWRPIASARPAMRWIVVLRDPRAVVASYRTAWGARDHVVLAERWRADQREAARLLRTLRRSALLLRFEEVVAFPDPARRRLGAFLGVEAAAGVAPPRSVCAPWETWKARATGPIDPARANAWREVLSPREAATVVAIAGDLMLRFGYPAPGRTTRLLERARIPPAAQRRRVRFRCRRARKRHRIASVGGRL